MRSSKKTKNQPGSLFSAQDQGPALDEITENLMERILSRENMVRAYQKVVSNKGAPGLDGVRVDELKEHAKEHWQRIKRELSESRYYPKPVLGKKIPKPTGGERLLGIPTVMDRMIQQAILQVLGPIFDPDFSESSFGFRPGRKAHGAVKRIQRYVNAGYEIAVDLDLEKFFDRVVHDKLMHRVARKVKDKRVLKLIGRYLRAGMLLNEVLEPTDRGVPQGGPLSPLLSNILLDDLDKELEKRNLHFARYADDLLIVVKSKKAANRVKEKLTCWLKRKLGLDVNEQKSKTAHIEKCSFLGFSIIRGRIWIARAALHRVSLKVKDFTSRSKGVSFESRIQSLNLFFRGWVGYFGLTDTYTWAKWLDGWIRRRLRMCLWKQWKRPKTRIRNLLNLGVPKDFAIPAGCSSKGPWRLSRTFNTHLGLFNSWFKDQGLFSLLDLWKSLETLRRTA